MAKDKPPSPLDSVVVNYYGSTSKSCQSKHSSTSRLIQLYLDELQDRLGLPRFNFDDINDTGGSFSVNEDDIEKWWFVFWKDQPAFWFSLKKSNGKDYAPKTLERYMPAIKNQLVKKFLLSRYVKLIEETYNSASRYLKVMVTAKKKDSPPPTNKVYTDVEIAFILQRALWFNLLEYIDFFVFQTALLRLSSRAHETSDKVTLKNLSIRQVCEGAINNILQCYLVRDKYGVDWDFPMIPNKHGVFGDLPLAIGLSLFLRDGVEIMLMPSVANKTDVSAYYISMMNSLWKRYSPAGTTTIRKGTSHWGKHTAQSLLDGCKLHVAARLFGGWNEKGARNHYFSNPFPYLLDGAKAMAGWSKVGDGYQRVTIPVIESELAGKIRSVFFGHIPDESLGIQVKSMILVCVLSKWDQLLDQIRAEPNGLFNDPRNHIILATLNHRLARDGVAVSEFDEYKSECKRVFNEFNYIDDNIQVVPTIPVSVSSCNPIADYSQSPFQAEMGVRPLKCLLDLVTRNTDPKFVFVSFFSCNFMESYKSTPSVNNKMQCKYRKIKAAVRVMVRFLDSYPTTTPPTLEEANVVMNRIKSVLLSVAPSVKHQGKREFNKATPLHLSIIRCNEPLLTEKSKPWYRDLPKNTPHAFIEHCYAHKIYDI